MTQGITNALNLPSMDELFSEEETVDATIVEDQEEEDQELILQKAQESLGMMNGAQHGADTEEIRKQTLKHAQEIVDLSFNVDQRSQRGLLEVAATFYKNALDAANSKRDAELKAMKLALDKRKLDLEEQKMRVELGEKGASTIDATGAIVGNRNDLIRQLLDMKKKND